MSGRFRDDPRAKDIGKQIRDGMREIGVLFIAFAPLETALQNRSIRETWPALFGFAFAGVVIFLCALVLEWRVAK